MRFEGEMLMSTGNIYRGFFKDDKFSGHGMLLMSA
jgi:hypothetical protein